MVARRAVGRVVCICGEGCVVNKLRFRRPDTCPCGHALPWHLVELTEPGDRFSHMCTCRCTYELSSTVQGELIYAGEADWSKSWALDG